MPINCKNFLIASLALMPLAHAEQALDTSVGALSVRQTDVIPVVADNNDDVVFSIEVTAACAGDGQELALVASVADTVIEATNDDGTESVTRAMQIRVPAEQLAGLQRKLLCSRIAKDPDNIGPRLISGAFSVQVVGICSAVDLAEQQHTVNAPLDVVLDCGLSSDAAALPGN